MTDSAPTRPAPLAVGDSLADDARKIAKALSDAIDLASESSTYKSNYLRATHGDDEEIERLKTALSIAESLPGKIEEMERSAAETHELFIHAHERWDHFFAATDRLESKLAIVTKERDEARKWAKEVERTNRETIDHAKGFVERSNAARLAAESQLAKERKKIDDRR